MKKILILFFFLALCFHADLWAQSTSSSGSETMSLAGIWKFKMDPFSTGISSNGVQLLPNLPEEITLPGSTDQAGKGYKTQHMTSLRLTRMFEYKGPAWYEKEIYVPEEWGDKEIALFLERVHWESQVWVNGKPAGRQESLSVPHIYDVTSLVQPGKKNTIRIRVNNDQIYPLEYGHAISAETQTNWNGIVGKIELQAFDKVNLYDVQVYPDVKDERAEVKIEIRNNSKENIAGSIVLSAKGFNTKNPQEIPVVEISFSGKDSVIQATANLPMKNAVLWDEFNPALYRLNVKLNAGAKEKTFSDTREVIFGMREVGIEGTRFSINDRLTFIRATVNCAEFPITGYPPTDVSSWTRIFKICQDYGLNAMRFHTWCPPEAAFVAADQLGFYLQAENSDWRFTVGKDSAANRFLKEDADRILKAYGNHPSFISFGEGNEMVGPTVKEFLSELVSHWKEQDTRRLYTGSSAYPLVPENDFNTLYGARPQRWKEGLKGRFNVKPLDTQYDYSEYIKKYPVPMITHEIGQWCVFPDFDQIPKYTGVLKPYNYELFRELLRDRHMLDQAAAFTKASGKFQVIQKKEEVESYFRTPGMAGYHLLQLNDFPGQGTSPVGIVDIFWDPKPYVAAEEVSQYQKGITPLLRTEKFTWTNNETFRAVAEFANFGASPLEDATLSWSLKYPDGTVYKKGSLGQMDIPLGSPINIGEISIALNEIDQATQMNLTIQMEGTEYFNQWDIWVYPEKLPDPSLKKVMVTDTWDAKAKRYLQRGGKVILLADTARIDSDIPPGFSGISWNAVWSGMPPNLLGILCDPEHPALADFPTEFHSNWQWWDMVAHSRPMQLDHMPASFKPVVQMIPDWNNPKKIGLVFEAKIGEGSLLVTAIDLKHDLENRPVARQMLYSLKKYASSDAFQPEKMLQPEMIDQLFKK